MKMTKTRRKPKHDTESNEPLLKHLVEMQEKLHYLMAIAVEHAAEIKEQRKVLDQVRNRMGI